MGDVEEVSSVKSSLFIYTRVRIVLIPFLVPHEQYLSTTTGQLESF